MSLSLYLFHGAARSVILRAAPDNLWRMIAWDRDAGTFTPGEWVRMEIDPDRCAVSPDGAHFLWFGVDGKWDRAAQGAYTAISCPPAFKPIALYPQGDRFGGGGYWVDDAQFVIQSGAATPDIVGEAPHLRRADAHIRRRISLRGLRRGVSRVDVPVPPDLPFTTQGARVLDAGGNTIADFTEMEPADV